MMTQSQPTFHVSFINTALAISVGAGLMVGTHLALPIGFEWNLPKYLPVWIQTHAHLQLVGWAGLFIMGVSLYFLPRLLKATLPHPALPAIILILVAGGLMIRSFAEFFIPYTSQTLSHASLVAVPIAAGAEWVGVVLYLIALMKMIAGTRTQPENVAVVRPYFLMMAIGFFGYESLQLAQVVLFDVTERLPWNEFSVELFMALVLLPVSIGFAVKTFPLFIQVPAVKSRVRWLGILYFVLTCISLLPLVPGVQEIESSLIAQIAGGAEALRDILIIWIIWELRLYQKMALPGNSFLLKYFGRAYVEARSGTSAFQKARKGFYDYGQYGRFELLIFSAFLWLTVHAVLSLVNAGSDLLGIAGSVGRDPVRHAFLLGFVTLLILGMGVRMLPGFAGQNGVKHPALVIWIVLSGNLAVLTRVVPLVLPSWLVMSPEITAWFMRAFGVSGGFAMTALILFAFCLGKVLVGRSGIPTTKS